MRFDIKTVSEANQREHWATKNRRKKEQQMAFRAYWRLQSVRQRSVNEPTAITFTRYSCKELDQDNLAGAFKHVQDQLARELGIDDGDAAVKWKYEQRKIAKRQHYFTIEIEALGGKD